MKAERIKNEIEERKVKQINLEQGLLTLGVGILPGSSDSSRSVHKKTQNLLVLT